MARRHADPRRAARVSPVYKICARADPPGDADRADPGNGQHRSYPRDDEEEQEPEDRPARAPGQQDGPTEGRHHVKRIEGEKNTQDRRRILPCRTEDQVYEVGNRDGAEECDRRQDKGQEMHELGMQMPDLVAAAAQGMGVEGAPRRAPKPPHR